MGSPSLSFHAAQRGALAVEIAFDLYARTRQTRHHSSNWHTLHLGYFAVAEPFQHHQEQGIALVLYQRGERAFYVAATCFRSGKIRSVVFLDRSKRRAP